MTDETVTVPDIRLSHTKKSDPDGLYITPASQNVNWWYVFGEEDLEEDSYKEGIFLSVHTEKRNYSLTLSTEAIREMYVAIVERVIRNANDEAGLTDEEFEEED